MAKYIKPTLTITSNKYDASSNPGPTSTPYNISVSDLLSISQVLHKIIDIPAGTVSTILDNADYTDAAAQTVDGGYVFLRNLSTSTSCFIGHGSAGDGNMEDDGGAEANRLFTLDAGEFAFFPWGMEADIRLDAPTGTTAVPDGLELILFVKTGTA